MKRRSFLFGLAALAVRPTLTKPQNIVLITADDLGYGDLGCYGQQLVQTPNIDALAAQGQRYTQAYAPCTVCAPSRWGLLTGQHTGHARTLANDSFIESPTIADDLKQQGYSTAIIGKWGIDNAGDDLPMYHGFDYFLGYRDHIEAHNYYPSYLWENDSTIPLSPGTYVPDLMIDRALEFIRSANKPYFLYLPSTIPHANNQADDIQVPTDAPYSAQPWPQIERNFAAAVTRLDGYVGQIMAEVDNNTIVIFTSDNGPHSEGGHDADFFDSAGGLRGIKRDLYEGGIRVPLIIRWPYGGPGVVDTPFPTWDIGRLLSGQPLSTTFYWGFYEGGLLREAVRLGDWKVIRFGLSTMEVYDLASDPGETTNLAGLYPAVELEAAHIMSGYCPAPKICYWLPVAGK